jgi:hypothetical protein
LIQSQQQQWYQSMRLDFLDQEKGNTSHPEIPKRQIKPEKTEGKEIEKLTILTSRSPAKCAAERVRRFSLSDAHQQAEASEEEHRRWGHFAFATTKRTEPLRGQRERHPIAVLR